MRKKVLLVIHPDHVEAYGDHDVDVWIAHFPKVGPAAEVQGERYVENSLPLNYRDLYYPGNLRNHDVLHCPTPCELIQRNWKLDMLHSLDKVGELLDTPF